METITRAIPQCKTCSAGNLNVERAKWLLEFLQRRTECLRLDGYTYKLMRGMYGFSKSELDRSIAGLRDAGLVTIEDLTVIPVEWVS